MAESCKNGAENRGPLRWVLRALPLFVMAAIFLFSSQTGEGSGGGQNSSGTAWTGGEEQARLIDRAFQRDSRRYDRGFSLY